MAVPTGVPGASMKTCGPSRRSDARRRQTLTHSSTTSACCSSRACFHVLNPSRPGESPARCRAFPPPRCAHP
eukprot:4407863-Prymnesium_polylepis.1